MPYVNPITLVLAYVSLHAAHWVADHWIQTPHQSATKGEKGRVGRLACASHVATYTLTGAVTLTALVWLTHVPLHGGYLLAGLAINAVTHYIADRREPLYRMAAAVGKDDEWVHRGGGAYALDQAWHKGWILIAAAVTAIA